MLEKNKTIRRATFVFSDDKIHPDVECQYSISVLENGKEITSFFHREIKTLEEMLPIISGAEIFVHEDE